MNRKENDMERDGLTAPMEYFDEPAPGQFHSLAADTDMWDAFVLVLNVNRQSMNTECTVVPGSMDALKGGPDDLLIRNPDRNGVWILDFSQVRAVLADALLPGFAALAPRDMDYVRKGLDLYRKKEESAEYRFGIPFIGKTDSRCTYHKDLGALVETANEEAERRFQDRLAASFRWTPGTFDPLPAAGFDEFEKTAFRENVACFSGNLVGKTGLAGMIADLFLSPVAAARASQEKEKAEAEARARAQKRARELSFFPEDFPGAAISLRFDLENGTIFAEVSSGGHDKRAFEGIQLRSSPGGHLLGTIRNGSMKAELTPDFLENGIYFSRPGDVPLKGKWEVN